MVLVWELEKRSALELVQREEHRKSEPFVELEQRFLAELGQTLELGNRIVGVVALGLVLGLAWVLVLELGLLVLELELVRSIDHCLGIG